MKLRKVMFKKWVPRELIGEGASRTQKEGTNCWESDFTHAGLFHQWSASYEEFESGAGNFTVGLVELTTGEIESVLPSNLKFVDSHLIKVAYNVLQICDGRD